MRKSGNLKKTLTSLLCHFYPLVISDPKDSAFIPLLWRTVHRVWKDPSYTCELGSDPLSPAQYCSTNSFVLLILPVCWILSISMQTYYFFCNIFRRSSPPPHHGYLSVPLILSQFNRLVVSDSLWPHGLQHARPSCPSPTTRAYSNSCPSHQWCHPTISSSVVPFSCLQSCPASGSLPLSQLFPSGSQSIGVSASASVLPMNTQDWSPLGWTGWISLRPKGLSGVFSSTTV